MVYWHAAVEETQDQDAMTRRWLRLSVATVWIATALLVFAPSYRHIGGEYLGRLGLPEWLMYLACAGELCLGIWIAVRPPTWWDSLLQIGGIVFFTAALAIAEPMLLVSPFGMLSKNLPMMMVIAAAFYVGRDERVVSLLLRVGVASIWITEGLFPKILFQQHIELEMARNSMLVWFDPALFVGLLGGAQVASGVLVLALSPGLFRKLLSLQIAALVLLPAMVVHHHPELLWHPFAPLIKNIPIVAASVLLMRRCRSE